MEIKDYESFLKEEIANVILDILLKNEILKISAKSRAGAEIGDWLEDAFVSATKHHKYIIDSESSPKGQTKHPWDARIFFTMNDHREEIWIDFKAFKLSSIDSNPDIGTPNKIIKFIEEGGFYLIYIHVLYEEHKTGLKFVKSDGCYVKSYFLKDISATFRRTPTNQLQVNMSAKPTYRTREEFIDLLMKKLSEGLERQLKNAQLKLSEVDKKTKSLRERNLVSEKVIQEKIQ